MLNEIMDAINSKLEAKYTNLDPIEARRCVIRDRMSPAMDCKSVLKCCKCGDYTDLSEGILCPSFAKLCTGCFGCVGELQEAISAFFIANCCPQDARGPGVCCHADLSPVIICSNALSALPDETKKTNWIPFKNYPFVTTRSDPKFNYSKTDRLEGWFENHHQSGNFDKQDIFGNYLHNLKGNFVRLVKESFHTAVKGQHVLDIKDDNFFTTLGKSVDLIKLDHSHTVEGKQERIVQGNMSEVVNSDVSRSVAGQHTEVISGDNNVKAAKHIFEGDVIIKGNVFIDGDISDRIGNITIHEHKVVEGMERTQGRCPQPPYTEWPLSD